MHSISLINYNKWGANRGRGWARNLLCLFESRVQFCSFVWSCCRWMIWKWDLWSRWGLCSSVWIVLSDIFGTMLSMAAQQKQSCVPCGIEYMDQTQSGPQWTGRPAPFSVVRWKTSRLTNYTNAPCGCRWAVIGMGSIGWQSEKQAELLVREHILPLYIS